MAIVLGKGNCRARMHVHVSGQQVRRVVSPLDALRTQLVHVLLDKAKHRRQLVFRIAQEGHELFHHAVSRAASHAVHRRVQHADAVCAGGDGIGKCQLHVVVRANAHLFAVFIHLFFVAVMLIVAAIYGIYPTIYTIQLLYYSFCLFILVLALCYSTCAIVVFFRDLAQIINILLQVGMWATPILWNMDDVLKDSPALQTMIKINPLVYIVNGYRSALCEKQWFFEDFYSTMYFWIITVVLFGIGAMIFKRLKVHFADVL